MSNIGRPSADLVDGNWIKGSGGNIDLFGEIDEGAPVDSDYVESPAAPVNEAMAVQLSSIVDPKTNTGNEVNFRYRKDYPGGPQVNLTVQLRQGYVSEASLGTLIAEEILTDIPGTWTAATLALTVAESDSIIYVSNAPDPPLVLRFVATQV